jgi:streptogramin lyase
MSCPAESGMRFDEKTTSRPPLRTFGWMSLPALFRAFTGNAAPKVRSAPLTVTTLAAGAGYIWATVPDDHAVWRIDPKTGRAHRIGLRYYPWGVAVTDDGIWVSLRAHDA